MSGTLKWKLLAGFVLVFLAGLAAGAFLGAAQSHHHRMDFGHHRSLTDRIRNRMQSRLDLTPEQMQKTAPIFNQAAQEIEAIRAETGRRVHQILAGVDRDLAPELTDQQRAKLQELKAEPHRKRGL